MPSRLPSICEDELMAACLASHASALSCARWRVHMRFGALPSHTLHSITSGLCIGRSLTRPPTTSARACVRNDVQFADYQGVPRRYHARA